MNYNLEFEVVPKSLILNGFYDIAGKVLVLPIVGKGKSKISLGNKINNYFIKTYRIGVK